MVGAGACVLFRAPAAVVILLMCLVFDASQAQGIPDLGKMMGGGGQKGSCQFKCANGIQPRPRLGHEPTFNGCGVPGFQVESKYGMTECCNQHDICYHTCQTGKDQKKGQEICDTQFEKCMLARCATLAGQDRNGCEGEANMMSSGVRMFGCAAYESSQSEACSCDLDTNDKAVKALSDKDRFAMLQSFYAKHDPSKTHDDMQGLINKYKKGRFVDLCRKLQGKYQEHPAAFANTSTKNDL